MPLYLDTYVGTGTEDDPFRPALADLAADWSAIDLRPDPTTTAGRCLVRCTAPASPPVDTVRIGDTPDARPAKVVRSRIEQRLGLAAGALGDVPLYRLILDLLTTHATEDGTRWRPLRPMSAGPNAWEIHLDGLVYSVPRISGGASYSDDFNRANAATLGANWTEYNVEHEIVSNQAEPTTAGTAGSFYASLLATDDHYSQATLANIAGTSLGVAARASSIGTADSSTGALYLWRYNGSNSTGLLKKPASSSTYTAIGTAYSATLANGDVLKIEVNGSTIKGYVNGVERASVTDTDNATGKQAGFRTSGSASAAWDNWSAADLTSGTNAAAENVALTATADNAQGAVAPSATESTATVAAQDPQAGISPSGAEATATAAAEDATGSVAPVVEVAVATATANDATVTTSGAVNASAEAATVAATAHDATASIAPNAEAATSTGTAHDPQAAIAVLAEAAAIIATAYDATVTTAVTGVPGRMALTDTRAGMALTTTHAGMTLTDQRTGSMTLTAT